MAALSNIDYSRGREIYERELADADSAVAAIHLKMAERYAELVLEASAPANLLRLVPATMSGKSL